MYCRLAVLMAEKDPKLSQRKLAEDTGLGITTVNRLFNNSFDRVDRNTVETLCDYFDREVGDLFILREVEQRSKAKTMQQGAIATVATGKPEFNPGDCCKMPSGARVFIDRRLDDGRYAVTWESTGDDDVVPAHLLTFVCHAK